MVWWRTTALASPSLEWPGCGAIGPTVDKDTVMFRKEDVRFAAEIGIELSAFRNLTPRQREVLAVMMEGKCNKAIGRTLNLAEPTVRNHVTAILRTLKAANRTEAVLKVARASAAAMSDTFSISGYSPSLGHWAPAARGA
jgi:DNA-binding CsgD family transcriptional regulator